MKKIVIILLSILFMGCEYISAPPDNAQVFLSHSKKQYTSPPCIENGYSDSRVFNVPSTQLQAHQ